jgi:mycothiol synthase
MDESRYLLRELREGDYPAVVAVQNTIYPHQPDSVETFRHYLEEGRQAYDVRYVVVVDRRSEELVGSGVLFNRSDQRDLPRLWIQVGVLPDRRREGVGSYLYDSLASEARRRGATGLRASVQEDSPDGRAFLTRRGFRERRRSWRSGLEVDSADTSGLPELVQAAAAMGIEFTTLAKEGSDNPGVQRRVHDLDTLAGLDEPQLGPPTPIPFEEWRGLFMRGPNFLADAWFLAKHGDRFVGVSYGAREAAQPGVLQQYFTGTHPDYRRKQIALTLKLQLIDYAKRKGFARIETNNDSLNIPMWTLNQKLGFRRLRERIHLECEFTTLS